MIGSSKNKTEKIIRENTFEHKKKETRVKFNPGLSANPPSSNWALYVGKISFKLYLIEWNSDETRQTPLCHVFVDLAVNDAHSIPSILILLTNKNVPIFTFCQLKTKDGAPSGSFQHKLQHRRFIFHVCHLSKPVSSKLCSNQTGR